MEQVSRLRSAVKRRAVHLLIATSFAAAYLTGEVRAEDYPTRPIHLIVGFAPGGPTDILSRILADQLSKSLGARMIVENRAGAGGNIAASAVARAPADGYTLLFGGTNYVIGRSWYKNLQFDLVKDFRIVSTFSHNSNVLVVNPESGMKSLEDVLRQARAKPGYLTFGSGGTGTVIHLAGELFRSQEKLDLVHVPYTGVNPAELDLMAGRLSMIFDSLTTALPFVRSEKLRAIGVTSKDRSSYAPEIRTLAEQGLTGFDVTSWYAVWAPSKVPPEILTKLNLAIRDALATPEVKAGLARLQAEAFGKSLEASESFQKEELTKWTGAVESLGPRPD